ncbi:hypothetical protein MtrunA17_Chr5g0427861 [Medicago truncatula]|uniref:Uncharacterized protein n=1 Tax=Medicago truncatula TaxID=3880 RepID=A0A396HSG6_MEDTR|nr:hypothetical protein MtrunA17_Chr5g0427861 [Medicago truncatula]
MFSLEYWYLSSTLKKSYSVQGTIALFSIILSQRCNFFFLPIKLPLLKILARWDLQAKQLLGE